MAERPNRGRNQCITRPPEDIVLKPVDDYVRRFATEAPRSKVVTAGTAVRRTPVLSGDATVAEALETISVSESRSAIVEREDEPPVVVTKEHLLAGSVHRTAYDVAVGEAAVVSEEVKLAEVMRELVRTGSDVIVRDSHGLFLGTVSNSGVVRALSIS